MKKKKTVKDHVLNILLVFFILVFLGSGGYLGYYYYSINKSESRADELEEKIENDDEFAGEDFYYATVGDAEKGKEALSMYVEVDGKMILRKYSKLYQENTDFIGWLYIPGTKVGYPVMFTPNDEEFYLRKNFDKEYSTSGTLFVSKYSDVVKPTDNVVIYGHNMKAGTMFHDLLNYADESYYQEHKTVVFNTIYGNAEYEVIAAFQTNIKEVDDTSFKYYQFFDANDPSEFDEYVNNCKALTPYNIPVTAEYGDKLITLSTCSYHTDEGRYVVVAKRVK
jgi:sortase B